MVKIREAFEKILPRKRGGRVFLLGTAALGTATAVTAGLIHLAVDRDNSNAHNAPRPQPVSWAVGVLCASQVAQVSETQMGNVYTFHCDTSDGRPSTVTELMNLDPARIDEIRGYNRVVALYTGGAAIKFDLIGDDGLALVEPTYQYPGYNDTTIGIARVNDAA